MAHTTVRSTITGPGGVPRRGVRVRCSLTIRGDDPDTVVTIGAVATTRTSSHGHYRFDLVPNSALSPAGTRYMIDEAGSPDPKVIVVPPAAEPVRLADLEVQTPVA